MALQPRGSSEVAWLREQIAREHEAASWALDGLAVGAAKHLFISRRMDRIAVHQQRLSELVGEQMSMEVVMAVMEKSPPQRAPQENGGRRGSGAPDAPRTQPDRYTRA